MFKIRISFLALGFVLVSTVAYEQAALGQNSSACFSGAQLEQLDRVLKFVVGNEEARTARCPAMPSTSGSCASNCPAGTPNGECRTCCDRGNFEQDAINACVRACDTTFPLPTPTPTPRKQAFPLETVN